MSHWPLLWTQGESEMLVEKHIEEALENHLWNTSYAK